MIARPKILAWLLCLSALGSGSLQADDKANRTLLGNQAVRQELAIAPRQAEQLDAILAEMESEIADKLRAAQKDGEDLKVGEKDQIADAVVEAYRERCMELLDKQQSLRLWQIGAQAEGWKVFSNPRVRRILQYSPQQIEKINTLVQAMQKKVVKAATDVSLDVKTVQQIADREQQSLYKQCLTLLTDEQRTRFGELLGKPFDRDLLNNSAGAKPRSLTFVFSLTCDNGHALLADPQVQKQLDLTTEQTEKIQALLVDEEHRLTAVRLGVLQPLDVDFADLPDQAKTETALKIVTEGTEIMRDIAAKVGEILSDKQAQALDRLLIKQIGARAIGAERIAKLLKLTPKQRQAFAKADAAVQKQTAAMRVVRREKDFDGDGMDRELSAFEQQAAALLTPPQSKKLASLKND